MNTNAVAMVLELDTEGRVTLSYSSEPTDDALSNPLALRPLPIVACAEHLSFLVRREFQTELRVIAREAATALRPRAV